MRFLFTASDDPRSPVQWPVPVEKHPYCSIQARRQQSGEYTVEATAVRRVSFKARRQQSGEYSFRREQSGEYPGEATAVRRVSRRGDSSQVSILSGERSQASIQHRRDEISQASIQVRREKSGEYPGEAIAVPSLLMVLLCHIKINLVF